MGFTSRHTSLSSSQPHSLSHSNTQTTLLQRDVDEDDELELALVVESVGDVGGVTPLQSPSPSWIDRDDVVRPCRHTSLSSSQPHAPVQRYTHAMSPQESVVVVGTVVVVVQSPI